MPRIRQYTAEEGLDATPLVYLAQAQAATGRARARMFEGLGNTALNLVKQAEQDQQRRETMRTTADLAKKQAELSIEWEKTKAHADPNDPELAARFLEDRVKPALEASTRNLWTTGGQDFAAQHVAKLQADFFARTTVDQMDLARKAVRQNLEEIKRANGVTVSHQPSALEQVIEQQHIAIETLGDQHNLTATERQALAADMNQEVALTAATAEAEQQPRQLIYDIQHGRYDAYLTGDQLTRLRQRAESQIESNQDLALAPKRFEFQNDMVRVQHGFAPRADWADDDLRAIAGRDRHGNLNEENFLRLRQARDTAKAVGSELSATQGMPFAERAARLAELEKDIGRSPDAKVAAERLEAASSAFKAAAQAYKNDPAEFVAEENPAIAKALDTYAQTNDPADWQKYLTLQAEAQARYDPTSRPTLLPKTMREQLAIPLQNMETAADAQQAAALIGKLRSDSGRFFGEVASALGDKFPPSASVAASLMAAGKDGDARLVLQASTKEAKKLVDATVPAGTRGLVALEAADALDAMAATMPDQAGQINAMREAVVNATLWKTAHGEKTTAAAEAKRMITGDYEFWQNVRIPKTVGRDAVKTMLTAALDTIEPVVPGGTAPPDDYRASLKRHGVWVTTPSGTGAYLTDGLTGYPVYEVVNGQAQPVVRSIQPTDFVTKLRKATP